VDREIYPIDLTDLLSGRQNSLSGELNIEIDRELAEVYEISEPFAITLRYKLTKDRNKLILSLEFSADLTLICDRCLTPYSYAIHEKVEEFFMDSIDNQHIPQDEWKNTIIIPTQGIGSFNFDLTPNEIKELLHYGYEAVMKAVSFSEKR